MTALLLTMLVVLVQLQFTYSSEVAGILTAPESRRAVPDVIVSFNCSAVACNGRVMGAHWIVNNTYIVAAHPDIEELGFQFNSATDNNNSCAAYSLGMTVHISNRINNTRIVCHVSSNGVHDDSTPAYIIVLGAPSVPLPKLILHDEHLINISWIPPFSPPEYPITGYTYEVLNASSDESLIIRNISENFVPYMFEESTVCAEIVFRVSASNFLGTSLYGEIRAREGPVTAPAEFGSPVRAKVFFTYNAAPTLKLDFQLPAVCYYQEINYTVIIEPDDGSGAITVGPKTVQVHTATSCPPEPELPLRSFKVVEEVSDGLAQNANYSVRVRADTIAGNSTSDPVYVSTVLNLEKETSGKEGNTVHIVLGIYSASVSVLLCLSAALLCVCHRKLRRSTVSEREVGKAQRAMVSNPIYEGQTNGPVYECIPQPLLSNAKQADCGSPESPSASSVRYFEKPLQLPLKSSPTASSPSYSTSTPDEKSMVAAESPSPYDKLQEEADLTRRQVREHLQLPLSRGDTKIPINGSINLTQLEESVRPAEHERQNRRGTAQSRRGGTAPTTIPTGVSTQDANYTIMSPAGTVSHSVLSAGWGEQSPEDSNKYAE